MTTIREERAEDAPAIRLVLEQAFGQPNEADLVDSLRLRGASTLSLIATQNDQIVGHTLFSPVSIEGPDPSFSALGLGPMAVLPQYQNQGIGSELVLTGLQRCRDLGHEVVVVLGHPDYYSRFGFKPAHHWGISCEFDVPDEAFTVMELVEAALAGRKGVVKYQPEFSHV